VLRVLLTNERLRLGYQGQTNKQINKHTNSARESKLQMPIHFIRHLTSPHQFMSAPTTRRQHPTPRPRSRRPRPPSSPQTQPCSAPKPRTRSPQQQQPAVHTPWWSSRRHQSSSSQRWSQWYSPCSRTTWSRGPMCPRVLQSSRASQTQGMRCRPTRRSTALSASRCAWTSRTTVPSLNCPRVRGRLCLCVVCQKEAWCLGEGKSLTSPVSRSTGSSGSSGSMAPRSTRSAPGS
jgi:hypothetical protein